FASQQLEQTAPTTYERYQASKPNRFLAFETVGLDGSKVGVLEDGGKELARVGEILEEEDRTDRNHAELSNWWNQAEAEAPADKPAVTAASLYGGRMALKLTSIVPAI